MIPCYNGRVRAKYYISSYYASSFGTINNRSLRNGSTPPTDKLGRPLKSELDGRI